MSRAMTPRFIGHEIYRTSTYGTWHPLRVPRVSTVMDLTRALGWLSADQYINSPRAKPAALLSFHTPPYIAALQQAEATQQVSAEIRARHRIGLIEIGQMTGACDLATGHRAADAVGETLEVGARHYTILRAT